MNELYRPFVVVPVTAQANADLASERLRGFEVGLDWQAVQAVVPSVTAFDNRMKNAIANVTIGPNLRRRANLPAIEARGIEASLAARVGTVSLDGALAWADGEVRGEGPSADLDGLRLRKRLNSLPPLPSAGSLRPAGVWQARYGMSRPRSRTTARPTACRLRPRSMPSCRHRSPASFP